MASSRVPRRQVGLHNVGYSVCSLILDFASINIFWLISWLWGERGSNGERHLTWEIRVFIFETFCYSLQRDIQKGHTQTPSMWHRFPSHLANAGFNLCCLAVFISELTCLIPLYWVSYWSIWSHQFMANSRGKSGSRDRFYFLGWMVAAAMKLRCLLLGRKSWQT